MLTKLKPKAQVTPLFSAPETMDTRRAEAWLSDRLERGKREFFSEVVTVTPALAEIILQRCNHGNRPVRERRVEELAQIIREGRWLLTAQGVSVSAEGLLNNGQHRFKAVITSGRTVEMMVTFGEDRRAFLVHDTQAVRGGADTLHVVGHHNTAALAAAAKLLYEIEHGRPRGGATLANDILVEVVGNNPDLPGIVSWAHSVASSLKTSGAGISVAAYFISRKYADDMVHEWFDRVRTGLNITSERDPIYRLRKVLPSLKSKRAGIAAVTIKAWNAGRSKRSVGAFMWRVDEKFPEVR